jgi:hypothetical protein
MLPTNSKSDNSTPIPAGQTGNTDDTTAGYPPVNNSSAYQSSGVISDTTQPGFGNTFQQSTVSDDAYGSQPSAASLYPSTSNVLIPADNTFSSVNNNIDTQINASDTLSATPPGSQDDSSVTGSFVSSQVPTKYGGKKIIATIFGVVLLIAGVAAGVYLVNQQQDLRERAASASECTQSPDCKTLESPGNQGSFTAPRTIDHLFITAQDYHRYDPPGTNDGCYDVSISGNSLTWNRVGDGPNCKDISNIQVWMGGTPIDSPTPTQTATATLSPTQAVTVTVTATLTPALSPSISPTTPPTQTTAQCSEVKVYNTSWQLLNSSDLAKLEAGDVIRITVSGTASAGSFSKARFVINGVTTSETTNKKTGSDEFYYQYTIPENVSNFSFNGEVFHSELGWI